MPAPKPGSPAFEKRVKQKADAIVWAGQLYHYKLIARAVGLTDDTLKKWRDEDDDFSDSIEQERTRFLSKHIKRSRPEFLLERLEPDLFKQRTEQELSNPDGSLSPYRELTAKELRKLAGK